MTQRDWGFVKLFPVTVDIHIISCIMSSTGNNNGIDSGLQRDRAKPYQS